MLQQLQAKDLTAVREASKHLDGEAAQLVRALIAAAEAGRVLEVPASAWGIFANADILFINSPRRWSPDDITKVLKTLRHLPARLKALRWGTHRDREYLHPHLLKELPTILASHHGAKRFTKHPSPPASREQRRQQRNQKQLLKEARPCEVMKLRELSLGFRMVVREANPILKSVPSVQTLKLHLSIQDHYQSDSMPLPPSVEVLELTFGNRWGINMYKVVGRTWGNVRELTIIGPQGEDNASSSAAHPLDLSYTTVHWRESLQQLKELRVLRLLRCSHTRATRCMHSWPSWRSWRSWTRLTLCAAACGGRWQHTRACGA